MVGEAGEVKMSKFIYILALNVFFSGCVLNNSRSQFIFEDHYHYGHLNKNLLMNHKAHPWFKENYDLYKPNTKQLDNVNFEYVSVRIFMGTWCHDSKREVPRFYKVWDSLNLDESKIAIIGLTKKKKGYFKDYSDYDIKNTPTFIIYHKNNEIGRIIERPRGSIEKHIKLILNRS